MLVALQCSGYKRARVLDAAPRHSAWRPANHDGATFPFGRRSSTTSVWKIKCLKLTSLRSASPDPKANGNRAPAKRLSVSPELSAELLRAEINRPSLGIAFQSRLRTSASSSEIGASFARAERNPEGGFHGNRRSVFHRGLKLPLGDRVAGELVQPIIYAAQHAHRAYPAIGEDDGMQDDGAGKILPHQFQRIGWVNFTRGHRRGQVGRFAGGIRRSRICFQRREVDDPAASARVQVGHVEAERVDLASAKKGPFGFGDFGVALRGRARNSRRGGGGKQIRIDQVAART